jgi:hypothetical protein
MLVANRASTEVIDVFIDLNKGTVYLSSIIIALNGDVQPRIKAPFPFQNILSRPWSVKISLTDGTSCWIHLVKPWICGLSSILHCRKNGPLE